MFVIDPYRFGFSPAQLPNLTYWFESQDDASFTLLSGNVTGWKNLAGATTLTAVNSPSRQTVNGKQMLRFNGSNQLCVVADNAEYKFGSGDFSLFTVSRSDDTNRGTIVSKHAGTVTYLLRYNNLDINDGDFVAFIRDAAAVTGNCTLTDIVHNNNTVRVIGMVRDGNTMRFYRGATEVTTADITGMGSIDSTAAFNVGSLAGAAPLGAGAQQFLKGDIGEIVAVKRALSSAERAALIGYLNTKWGL